ncbi:MAG: phenylacetate--CoA ligase family protein [Propionibacterium sp.]|nr:phenylacetate--CoA ligase family protein [Propionibacterium sp.]
MTKAELVADFDRWVCDPAVTLPGVEEFAADPSRTGKPFLGRYLVCSSSGTTARPAPFLHDRQACRTYEVGTIRVDLAWLTPHLWPRMLARDGRWAVVVGAGGHYAGEAWVGYERGRGRWRRCTFRMFPLQQPADDLVATLDAFDPAVLTGYPSGVEMLAAEQDAGRLHLRLAFVELAGESVSDVQRNRIAEAFGAPVHEAYSASECLVIGFDCGHGWLHRASDHVILEPVESDLSPTPPGRPSHTVLLTNLANRVQPLIRYDLGDSLTVRSGRCLCGSLRPAFRVAGRRDDVLLLDAVTGGLRPVPPLALGAAVDQTPGVLRSRVVQTAPDFLALQLALSPGAPATTWDAAAGRLRAYLDGQGLLPITIIQDDVVPEASPSSGKYRQVVALPR